MKFVYYGYAPFNLPHWRIAILHYPYPPSTGLKCNESVWMVPGMVEGGSQ